MDGLINNFNDIAPLSLIEVIIAILMSLTYSFVIAKVYLLVHKGYSYSKSYLHTMIMISVTVALIMVIIGSEIARAFALVGAMSIIRFRNPVKDPRDVAFLFVTIAIGMACGVGFYFYATVFTATITTLMLAMHYFHFGELPNKTYIIKVLHRKGAKDNILEECYSYCSSVSLLSIERENKDYQITVMEIELQNSSDYNQLLNHLNNLSMVSAVNLLVGESDINA